MTIFDNAANWFAQKVASFLQDERSKDMSILSSYYSGDHRPQLKRTLGKQDDNIIQNFIGLAVDRSVSRLFRGGVTFKLPEAETGEKDEKGKPVKKATKQQEWLDRLMDLNKQEILLYQLGLHGAVYGTPFVKIVPDGFEDPLEPGTWYPRLIAIDPEIIRVKTDPQDMDRVVEYKIEFKVKRMLADGIQVQESAYREITRPANDQDMTQDEDGNDVQLPPDTWVVERYEQRGNQWELIEKVNWPYNFPPIHHWKNLPSLKSCYGDSDIDDAINIQDKSNFVVSNMGKIIKFHAHPQTIGTGFSVKGMEKIEGAVGAFHTIQEKDARVYNLEMSSDLASSVVFSANLRQSIFDISREVDMSSMADKLGALTNFALRVLYSDALDKNDTKRELYGDALREIVRRLLVIGGYEGPASDPGEIKWGDPLPVNLTEELTADQTALDMGIVDKQTVSERYKNRYGLDWEEIQKRLEDERNAAMQGDNNIGAFLLRSFNRGGETPPNGREQMTPEQAAMGAIAQKGQQ